LAPAGEVGGIPTIDEIPANDPAVPEGTWHETQLLEMPAWLIFEPLNFAPSTTGVAEMLEPAPTWQTSHDALVGMWLPGKPTIEKFAEGMAKVAAAAPWHCAQFTVVLGALAWIAVNVGITAKSVLVWHEEHWALVAYGMWLAGLSIPVKAVVLLWHCEQSPALGWAASATA